MLGALTFFTSAILIAGPIGPDMESGLSDSGMPGMELRGAGPAEELTGEWLTDFAAARRLAGKTGRPLLLHFDATWCPACVRMESAVLHRDEVRDLLRGFVPVRVDADTYRDLIVEYQIATLPTEVLVSPEGAVLQRFTGAATLSEYKSRLSRALREHSASGAAEETDRIAESDADNSATESESSETSETDEHRSCLIRKHDGRVVGLGGFSPVSLLTSREWTEGKPEFRVEHEGVDYFLASADEVQKFQKSPETWIPRLHGCDPVELQLSNQACAGVIEFGAFYGGNVYFFSSVANRVRFESNPRWYADVAPDGMTANAERFPFVGRDVGSGS